MDNIAYQIYIYTVINMLIEFVAPFLFQVQYCIFIVKIYMHSIFEFFFSGRQAILLFLRALIFEMNAMKRLPAPFANRCVK